MPTCRYRRGRRCLVEARRAQVDSAICATCTVPQVLARGDVCPRADPRVELVSGGIVTTGWYCRVPSIDIVSVDPDFGECMVETCPRDQQ